MSCFSVLSICSIQTVEDSRNYASSLRSSYRKSRRLSRQKAADATRKGVTVAKFALPNSEDLPAVTAKQAKISPVSRDIALSFALPVFAAIHRVLPEPLAPVHMPETTVDIDNFAQTRKYNIRSAGKVAAM